MNMKTARFYFEPPLKMLLPHNCENGFVDVGFKGPQSAKHLIESLGVPHTEIGELFANGIPAGLGYLVHDGDQLRVRPAAFSDDGSAPVSEPCFVLDGHLGRLASHLRMLGLDCLYRNDYEDEELARISVEQGRVLLTRDRRLLMRKIVIQGYLLRSLDSTEQLHEVVGLYRLERWVKPFQRCLRCNHPLEPISKEAVLERLEPLTRKYFDEFRICPDCNQIYWKGSHYERMLELIQQITHQ